MAKEPKDYRRLESGLPGLSAELLRHHIHLYDAYFEKIESLFASQGFAPGNFGYPDMLKLCSHLENGIILHEYFFDNLTHKKSKLEGELLENIQNHLGSVESMFKKLGSILEGITGWALLVRNRSTRKLQILAVEGHSQGLLADQDIIVALDSWEHAYSTDYNIDKNAYIKAILPLIDWEVAAQRFESSLKASRGDMSYIYWPVSIRGGEFSEFHITCKFFGDAEYDVQEMVNRISALDARSPSADEIEFTPTEFDTKNDGKVPVLVLHKFPDHMKACHDAFEDIRKDDYPDYKPHITVPRALWEEISSKSLGPEHLKIEVGPLELKKNGVLIYTYTGKRSKAALAAVTTAGPLTLEDAFEEFRLGQEQGDYVGFLKLDRFEQDLREELEKVEGGPIYRCISYDNEDDLMRELANRGTGIYWSYNRDKAVCYWGDKDSNRAVLTGVATDSNIDWVGTLVQQLRPSTAGEEEVRLLPHKDIKISEIELFEKGSKESKLIPYNKQVRTGGETNEKPPAKVAANVDLGDMLEELMLVHFPTQKASPKVRFVDDMDCLAKTVLEPELGTTMIMVSSPLAKNKDLLRQVLCHELIHHDLFLTHGNEVAKHGEHFQMAADKINAVEGEGYVTEFADDTQFDE